MSEATASSDSDKMRIDPARAQQLAENIEHVIRRVDAVRGSRKVRVIAVSKLKPATDILALHRASRASLPPIRDFGENYAQELTEKAALLPRSIRWHMIGGLQTNKCRPLAEQVPNLWSVSSVDTAKKADALEKGRAAMREAQQADGKGTGEGAGEDDDGGDSDPRLRVLVQVNTSGEESKSGVEPGAATVELCQHVRDRCPSLRLAGLMTIGAIARSREASSAEEENEDFVTLRETRDKVAEALGIEARELELSMGMSADFEAAIAQGSDEVRVGTTIFGDRPAKKDAVI